MTRTAAGVWRAAGGASLLAVCTLAAALSAGGPASARSSQQTGTAAPAAGAAPNPVPQQGRGGPALAPERFLRQGPVLPLSPADEAARFLLPPGFTMTPVLSEPDVQEPAQIAFDGNGRMFVLEIRGYMQDKDASGELLPVGRISRHEDRDNDGRYETHTVFVDKLVFPRFVMPLGADAVLTKESNADEVWKFTDTNQDGVADRKDLFTTGFGRVLNVEHQESGLTWAMDNWMYSTINQVRLRLAADGGVIKEPTGANSSQWGVTQDNYGKVWFQGGASGMPGYFQFPVVYGFFRHPEQFEPNLDVLWGAPVLIGDMQGGPGAIRMPDGSLTRGTGAAGNDIFRGHRLPQDMLGDYFYGEAVGRIVRRLRPAKTAGLTQLRNVYPLSEFIRSTDPLFRPVDMTTAPDGTMYITDMYRGIIQESQWSGPGTYLRQRIEQYQLDKVVRHGRVWRLHYDAIERDLTQPRMLNETPAQLVTHLSHPNGWWRDSAQQLLVLRQDKSVVPALRVLVQSRDQLARMHALWVLEGLGAADAALLRTLLKDADPQIRMQAIRVSESLYKAGDRSFAADYRTLVADPDVDVVIQALLTLNTLKVPGAADVLRTAGEQHAGAGVRLVTATVLSTATPPCTYDGCAPAFTPDESEVMSRGEKIYGEVCFACHGSDGRGEPVAASDSAGATRAVALAGSPRVVGHRDYVIKVLLHGLTGPINGRQYPDVMIPFGQNTDEWLASIGSYVRNAFGNRAAFISARDVARARAAAADRRTFWSFDDLVASLPRPIVADAGWKLTASHNSPIAPNALTINPWASGQAQEAGMWFQIELTAPVDLTEIQFESVPPPPVQGRGAVAMVPGAPTRSVEARGVSGWTIVKPTGPVGFPRAYQVQTSVDGVSWSRPVAQGEGAAQTIVSFPPVRARFVRITQTATAADAPQWTIQKLRLFEAAARR